MGSPRILTTGLAPFLKRQLILVLGVSVVLAVSHTALVEAQTPSPICTVTLSDAPDGCSCQFLKNLQNGDGKLYFYSCIDKDGYHYGNSLSSCYADSNNNCSVSAGLCLPSCVPPTTTFKVGTGSSTVMYAPNLQVSDETSLGPIEASILYAAIKKDKSMAPVVVKLDATQAAKMSLHSMKVVHPSDADSDFQTTASGGSITVTGASGVELSGSYEVQFAVAATSGTANGKILGYTQSLMLDADYSQCTLPATVTTGAVTCTSCNSSRTSFSCSSCTGGNSSAASTSLNVDSSCYDVGPTCPINVDADNTLSCNTPAYTVEYKNSADSSQVVDFTWKGLNYTVQGSAPAATIDGSEVSAATGMAGGTVKQTIIFALDQSMINEGLTFSSNMITHAPAPRHSTVSTPWTGGAASTSGLTPTLNGDSTSLTLTDPGNTGNSANQYNFYLDFTMGGVSVKSGDPTIYNSPDG